MSDVERFEFAFAPSYERASRPFGITPKSAWVSIDDVLFDARFGHWRVSTPLANITEVEVTGPYHFFKTAGPARLATVTVADIDRLVEVLRARTTALR